MYAAFTMNTVRYTQAHNVDWATSHWCVANYFVSLVVIKICSFSITRSSFTCHSNVKQLPLKYSLFRVVVGGGVWVVSIAWVSLCCWGRAGVKNGKFKFDFFFSCCCAFFLYDFYVWFLIVHLSCLVVVYTSNTYPTFVITFQNVVSVCLDSMCRLNRTLHSPKNYKWTVSILSSMGEIGHFWDGIESTSHFQWLVLF